MGLTGFGLGSVCTCRARDKARRTAALIRFIGQEDGLLSHTHDGPRMYINIEGVCGCTQGNVALGMQTLCMQRGNPVARFAMKEGGP